MVSVNVTCTAVNCHLHALQVLTQMSTVLLTATACLLSQAALQLHLIWMFMHSQ